MDKPLCMGFLDDARSRGRWLTCCASSSLLSNTTINSNDIPHSSGIKFQRVSLNLLLQNRIGSSKIALSSNVNPLRQACTRMHTNRRNVVVVVPTVMASAPGECLVRLKNVKNCHQARSWPGSILQFVRAGVRTGMLSLLFLVQHRGVVDHVCVHRNMHSKYAPQRCGLRRGSRSYKRSPKPHILSREDASLDTYSLRTKWSSRKKWNPLHMVAKL